MSTDEKTLEAISALMDGEPAFDDARGMGDWTRDDAARKAWGRYHLISEAMHNNLPPYLDLRLADRISMSLRNEPTILAPDVPLRRAVLRPLTGFAIAASVAAMAVVGIQYGRQDSAPSVTATPLAAMVAPQSLQPGSGGHVRLAAGTSAVRGRFEDVAPGNARTQMNRYLVNYNEYRRSAAMQGMLPYVRIVADEQDR